MNRSPSCTVSPLVASLLATHLLAGCSLMGLEKDLGRETCSTKSDCADLNSSRPTGDACREWRCNPETSFCEVLAADGDDDRVPSAECAADGEAVDCDDTNAAIYPGNDEVCDGLDNDCDEGIDEALYSTTEPMRVVALGAEGAKHVSMAAVTSDDTVAVAYTAGDEFVAGARVVFPTAASTDTAADLEREILDADPVAIEARSVAIAPIGSDFAVAVVPTGACQRVVTGIVTSDNPVSAIPETLFAEGIPKEDGVCDADTAKASDVALAANGDDVLVAWVEREDSNAGAADWACGSTPSSHVLVNLVERVGDTLVPVGGLATVLGLTLAASPPAVVAVPGGGWLIAFSEDESDEEFITVVAARREGDALITERVDGTGVAETGGESRGDVAITLGPSSENEITVGLAFREGCSTGSSITADFFSYAPTTNAAVALEGTTTIEAGTARIRRPALAYLPSVGWFAAWESLPAGSLTREVKARRLGSASESDFTVITDTTSAGTPVGFEQGVHLRPQSNGVSFGVLSLARVDDETGIYGTVIECGAQ